MKGKQGLCRKTTTKKSKIRKIPLMVNLLLMGIISWQQPPALISRGRPTSGVSTSAVDLNLSSAASTIDLNPINSRLTIRGIFRILLFFVVVFLHKSCLNIWFHIVENIISIIFFVATS